MTKNEKLTLLLSGLALVVSICSVSYTVWRDFEDTKERVQLDIGQRPNNYSIEFKKTNFKNHSTIALTDWTVTITNNSSIPISLMSYDILASSEKGEWFYTGLDQGITGLSGQKIKFPITIKSGHAKRYIVHLGYLMKDSVFNAIPDKLVTNNSVSMKNLTVALAKKGWDLWGNKAEYDEIMETNSGYSISVPPFEERNNMNFIFEINTGRGNDFSSPFGPYFF